MIELTGYLASVLLAISLAVNNDLKFRWINTFGCLFFIIYGALIDAFPIILTNTTLPLINVYYLIKIYRTKEDFDLLVFKEDDQIIEKFLTFYKDDIQSYFPDYKHKEQKADVRFVVLRDMVIANIFVASLDDSGTATVLINYTVPKYRDYKVGKFIFEKENTFLISKGINCLVYQKVDNKKHESFLKKMGFDKELVEGRLGYKKCLV